jgi:hypothetical protein
MIAGATLLARVPAKSKFLLAGSHILPRLQLSPTTGRISIANLMSRQGGTYLGARTVAAGIPACRRAGASQPGGENVTQIESH